MIVRTATAICDNDIPPCAETLSLEPEDTQPFRTLTEAGWDSVVVGNEILTICPEHRRKP